MALQVAFLDVVHPRIRTRVMEIAPADWKLTFTASNQKEERGAAALNAEVAFIIGTGINADLLEAAPALRFVQKLGAGTDSIDRDACERRGVTVARLEAGNSVPVAEHTVMLMLAALRRLPYFDRKTREGAWLKEQGRGIQRQLANKRVGLIGLGAIGREVAKRLRGFDVHLCYYDIVPAGPDVEKELSLERLELNELLATSDIVSLHIPLLPQTRNMLDERRISLLKPGAVVINCARGGLIDEAALAKALECEAIFAAGLDTYAVEPPKGSPLAPRDDVVMTPHLAGATFENFEIVFKLGVRNALLFLAGKELSASETVVAPGKNLARSQASANSRIGKTS